MAIMSTSAIPQTAGPKAATSTWNLDPVHSVAEFKVKHMMISNVKGQFANVGGVLTLDEGDPTNSRIEASIEVASVNTRERAARYAPEKRGLLSRGEVSEAVVQVDANHSHWQRRPCSRRRLDHSRGHSQCGIQRGRTDACRERSMGQYTPGALGNHEDQPQRFRLDLERCAGGREYSCGR